MTDGDTSPRTKVEKLGEVERVYRQLKVWLIDCVLPPGSYMSEVELARRCNTSRTPVREACNRLHQEKWIDRMPQKGYFVRPVSVREIIEIYEFRRVLECFAAEKLAQIVSPGQLADLDNTIAIERVMDTPNPDFVIANERFHLKIAEFSGNQMLFDHLKLTIEYVKRIDRFSQEKSSAWLPHSEVLRAIASHDPTASRQAMASHIDLSRDRMLKLFGS